MRKKTIDFEEDYNKLTYKGKDNKEYSLYLKENEISIFHNKEYVVLNQITDLFDELTITKIIDELTRIDYLETGDSSGKIIIFNTKEIYNPILDAFDNYIDPIEESRVKKEVFSIIRKENPHLEPFNPSQIITYDLKEPVIKELKCVDDYLTELFIDGVSIGYYKLSPNIIKKIENNLIKESEQTSIGLINYFNDIAFTLVRNDKNDINTIKSYISKGADINYRNGTLLKIVTAWYGFDTAKWLIENGADLYKKDKDGKTTIDYIKSKQNYNILKPIINKIEGLKYFKEVFNEYVEAYMDIFNTTLYSQDLELDDIKANIDMFYSTIVARMVDNTINENVEL